MQRSIGIAVCCVAILSATVPNAAAQTYAEQIVSGLTSPMFGTFAPNDESRLFVGRIWAGRIDLLDLNTRTMAAEPFLTIDDVAHAGRVEQGLLGLTFDPDYATNGYFYVDYTATDNSVNVVRYRVLGDPATSNTADPTSAYPILNVPKGDFFWHNAGWIEFGPNDGYLYVNIGAPAATDAQDITNNLNGKVLRIDVQGDDFPDDATRNYAIPSTNPFVGKEGDDEIWAFGFRNPFRASFDRSTGDLWINDTGEAAREEVNFQPADSTGGENYGWARREGSITGPAPHGGPLLPEYVEPVYDYAHDESDPLFVGNVIAGSAFYRGPVDAFYGHYFFSDNGSRNIWKLDPDAVDPRASVTNVKSLLLPDAGNLSRVPTFGEDAAGNMYLMDFDANTQGDIFLVTTASKRVVWNGDDVTSGVAGDGMTWGNANNWTRDGDVDVGFVAQDSVIFAAGSSQPVVELGADRTVAAITFQAPAQLQGNTLTVLSGNVFVEPGVTATIDSTLSAETVNHSIRKMGAGTLVVNGHSGQIAVKEGTLAGDGTFDHLTVHNGGTVAPGESAGIMTVDDSFTMESGASLVIEIGGTDNSNPQDPEFDQVLIGGAANLSGTLSVHLIAAGGGLFNPASGNSFPVLSAVEGLNGSFDILDLPALPTGLVWQPNFDGMTFSLDVGPRLPGDYNGNGIVDAADYVAWRNSQGQTGTSLAADGSGPTGVPDGVVDNWDYSFWRANFGATEQGVGANSVPEPAATTLLVFISISLLLPRRSRTRALR